MLGHEQVKFVKVTDIELLDFINSAKERIIIAKPAYSKQEIEDILSMIKNKGIMCKLYLESDDNAIRCGFGEAESLELIRNNLDILNAQIIDRIKMGILIVDKESLIYTPNTAFMEQEFKSTFPNGFLGGGTITQQIINQLINDLDQGLINKENIVPFIVSDSYKRNFKEVKDSICETISNLKVNPPADLNKLKKINFYRNKYKLVKLQVLGIKIQNRKISLRPFNSLLENQYERLVTSWNIFCEDDLKKLKDTKLFQLELKKIMETYLLDAGRFGYILDLTKKQSFDKEIKKLQQEFLDFFKGINKESKDNRFYKSIEINSNNQDTFKSILNKSMDDLYEYLDRVSKDDRKFMNEIYNKDRLLILERDKKNIQEEEIRKTFIMRYIINTLKFPNAQDIINRIDIKVDYYDISEELIVDNIDFRKIAKQCNSNVRQVMML